MRYAENSFKYKLMAEYNDCINWFNDYGKNH